MYDLDSVKIGERLRFCRVHNGLTLNDIAEKIYKTRATVSKIKIRWNAFGRKNVFIQYDRR